MPRDAQPTQPERQIAVFELVFEADDKVTRQRWNGRPMHSAEATTAFRAGIDAFRAAMAAHGYEKGSISGGILAEDYPNA